jgi:hypothetical protein
LGTTPNGGGGNVRIGVLGRMMIDGAWLLGMAALITSVTASIVTIITVLRKVDARTGVVADKIEEVRGHVDGRFDEIQAKVDRKIERGLMLEAKLNDAGIGYPPDRTDIVDDLSHRRRSSDSG